jgi:nicotinamidase-related amidase
MSGFIDKYNVLIIDPQVDFHEGGKLAVPGATGDSNRIIEFIKNKKENINKIFVSLDTHTNNHIGHPGYWKVVNIEGNETDLGYEIPPYTIFSLDKQGKIIGTFNGETKIFEPKNKELLEWTKTYITELPGHGKGVPLIWPTHCIETHTGENNTHTGHNVFEPLKQQLDIINITKDKVEYHIKGQNETTEMYSIFKAEIPVETVIKETITEQNKAKYYSGSLELKTTSKIESSNSDIPDRAYLQTTFNDELYKSLTKDGHPILICGEALSHCVNWSLRDLVDKLIYDNNNKYVSEGKLINGKIILLKNASSTIKDFEKNTDNLITFCKEKNVSIKYLNKGEVVDSTPSEGGKRRNKTSKKSKATKKSKKSSKTTKKHRKTHRSKR